MKYTKSNERKLHEDRQAGIFLFQCYRFDTSQHPVITSTAPRQSKITVPLTKFEVAKVQDMAQVLGCDANEVFRVIAWDYSLFAELRSSIEEALPKASNTSTVFGHSYANRTKKFVVKLPGSEATAIKKRAKSLKLSDAAFLQLCLIAAHHAIKNDELKRLTKSRLTNIRQLAQEWVKDARAKDGRQESKLATQRDAGSDAFLEAVDAASDRRKYEDELVKTYIMENPHVGRLINQDLLDLSDVLERAEREYAPTSNDAQIAALLESGLTEEEAQAIADGKDPDEPEDEYSEEDQLQWQQEMRQKLFPHFDFNKPEVTATPRNDKPIFDWDLEQADTDISSWG